jgi:hypothetical protein
MSTSVARHIYGRVLDLHNKTGANIEIVDHEANDFTDALLPSPEKGQ